MNYQHKLITDYIFQTIETHQINTDENLDLLKIVENKIGRLRVGENICVIVQDGNFITLEKLDDLQDTFNINIESIIISYRELERIFYETISI